MPAQLMSGRILLGLVLIILGVLFLLNTTGLADTGNVARWIPSLFILLGLWAMAASGFRSIQGPLTLIAIAGVVQLAVLGALTGEFVRQWWPLVLIFIGLTVLIGWFRSGRNPTLQRHVDETRLFTFLGNADDRPVSQAFRGGQVTTILGDATLDLREVKAEDGPTYLDVFVLLGDAKIRIPPEWTVRNSALVLLADYKDERRRPDAPAGGSPELVITGLAMLGDIKVME